MSRLTLFTSPTCAPCRSVKQFLALKNIEYKERSVDEEPELREVIVGMVGYSVFPTLVRDDGQFVAGFNLSKINDLINV